MSHYNNANFIFRSLADSLSAADVSREQAVEVAQMFTDMRYYSNCSRRKWAFDSIVMFFDKAEKHKAVLDQFIKKAKEQEK